MAITPLPNPFRVRELRVALNALIAASGAAVTPIPGPPARLTGRKVRDSLKAVITALGTPAQGIAPVTTTVIPDTTIVSTVNGLIAVVEAVPAPVLGDLALSASTLTEGRPEGTVIGTLLNVTAGSTLALTDDADGRVKLVGTQLQAGPVAAVYSASSPTLAVVVTEALAGATGSPKPNTLTVTILSNTVAPRAMTLADFSVADLPSPGGDQLTLTLTATDLPEGTVVSWQRNSTGAWTALPSLGPGDYPITVPAGQASSIRIRASRGGVDGTPSANAPAVTPTVRVAPAIGTPPDLTGDFVNGGTITRTPASGVTGSPAPTLSERIIKSADGVTFTLATTALTYTIPADGSEQGWVYLAESDATNGAYEGGTVTARSALKGPVGAAVAPSYGGASPTLAGDGKVGSVYTATLVPLAAGAPTPQETYAWQTSPTNDGTGPFTTVSTEAAAFVPLAGRDDGKYLSFRQLATNYVGNAFRRSNYIALAAAGINSTAYDDLMGRSGAAIYFDALPEGVGSAGVHNPDDAGDLLKGTVSDFVTVTGTDDPAAWLSRYASTGKLVQAASGAWRQDFDPKTGVCWGARIERGTVNTLASPRDLANAAWVGTAVAAITTARDNTAGPVRLQLVRPADTTTSTAHFIQQARTKTGGAVARRICWSAFVASQPAAEGASTHPVVFRDATGATWWGLAATFNSSSGTWTQTPAASGSAGRDPASDWTDIRFGQRELYVDGAGNRYWRIWISFLTSARVADVYYRLYAVSNGAVVGTASSLDGLAKGSFWGNPQAEEDRYYPTSFLDGARVDQLLSFPLSALGWRTAGSLTLQTVFGAALPPTGVRQTVLEIATAIDRANRLTLERRDDGTVHFVARSGGVEQFDLSGGTVTAANSLVPITLGWDHFDSWISVNNAAAVSTGLGVIPALAGGTVFLGCSSSPTDRAYLDGWLKRL